MVNANNFMILSLATYRKKMGTAFQFIQIFRQNFMSYVFGRI